MASVGEILSMEYKDRFDGEGLSDEELKIEKCRSDITTKEYKARFNAWLSAMKKSGGYREIVEKHSETLRRNKRAWGEISNELNTLFITSVWFELKERRRKHAEIASYYDVDYSSGFDPGTFIP